MKAGSIERLGNLVVVREPFVPGTLRTTGRKSPAATKRMALQPCQARAQSTDLPEAGRHPLKQLRVPRLELDIETEPSTHRIALPSTSTTQAGLPRPDNLIAAKPSSAHYSSDVLAHVLRNAKQSGRLAAKPSGVASRTARTAVRKI